MRTDLNFVKHLAMLLDEAGVCLLASMEMVEGMEVGDGRGK